MSSNQEPQNRAMPILRLWPAATTACCSGRKGRPDHYCSPSMNSANVIFLRRSATCSTVRCNADISFLFIINQLQGWWLYYACSGKCDQNMASLFRTEVRITWPLLPVYPPRPIKGPSKPVLRFLIYKTFHGRYTGPFLVDFLLLHSRVRTFISFLSAVLGVTS